MKRWPGTGRSRRRTEIRERRLIFKRDDTKPHTTDRRLQKAINASLNQVRIEDLLLEVEGKHYTPTQRTLWGRARGIKSGAARRKGTPLEDDQTPWLSMGISRAWWYRRYRHAQE